jgi:hypothetical protein
MNPLLSSLITEGETIVNESADAMARQGDTATIHITQVVNWHHRAASFIGGASPALVHQIPHFFQTTEDIAVIHVAVSTTLSMLKSLAQGSQPAAAATSTIIHAAPPLPPGPGRAVHEKPKTLAELFIEVFVPRNRALRFVLVLLLAIAAIGALVWSGLPDDTKKEILRPASSAGHGRGQATDNTSPSSVSKPTASK